METIVEVRPEEGGPKISVMAPRGNPSVSVSREAIPVGTLSKTRRPRSVKGDEIRSPSADSNRARVRMTDCIEVHRDSSHLYRTFVRYVNGAKKCQSVHSKLLLHSFRLSQRSQNCAMQPPLAGPVI